MTIADTVERCRAHFATGATIPVEARIEALYTTPKYRGHDAATALLSQVRVTLLERGVRFVRINVPRRNQRALRLLQRAHFEWVRTDRLFLGVDL